MWNTIGEIRHRSLTTYQDKGFRGAPANGKLAGISVGQN